MKARIVTKETYYGQGYDEQVIFVEIDDRVFEFAAYGYGRNNCEAKVWEDKAREVVRRALRRRDGGEGRLEGGGGGPGAERPQVTRVGSEKTIFLQSA